MLTLSPLVPSQATNIHTKKENAQQRRSLTVSKYRVSMKILWFVLSPILPGPSRWGTLVSPNVVSV